MKFNRLFKGPVAYLLLILVLVFLFFEYMAGGPEAAKPKLTEVVTAIEAGPSRVTEVTLEDRDQKITGKYADGKEFESSYAQNQGQTLFDLAKDKGIPATVNNRQNNVFLTILINFLPFVLILLLFFFLMQQMQGGGNRVMSFGKSRPAWSPRTSPRSPSRT